MSSSSSSSSSCFDHPAVSMPHWWEEAADAIAYDSPTDSPPISVVCGPGNTGKSTFSRLLLDTLLKRYKKVGYLDTDVGQPEFTPPGCLSLHIIDKPPPDLAILCLKKPERCFFYGDVNCQKDTNIYLSNILCLYDYFCTVYYQPSEIDNPVMNMLPLVVNTSGWVKGHGYDLLVEMLRNISPTHVVQIRVPAESKNLPEGMFWLNKNQNESANLIEICAAQKDSTYRLKACILRDLRIIAYFRQCLARDLDIASYAELARNLASIPAYEVPFSKFKVTKLHGYVNDTSSSEISHSLNATIVGLGISSLENPMPWCIGLGFVRAVDVSKDLLYVITPVQLRVLEKINVILQGCIEVPSCLLQCLHGSLDMLSKTGEEQLKAVKELQESLKILNGYLAGKKFFGGEIIRLVDIVAGWIPSWFRIIEEIIGIKIINEQELPLLCMWIHSILDLDLVKESMPPLDKVKAYISNIRESVLAAQLST